MALLFHLRGSIGGIFVQQSPPQRWPELKAVREEDDVGRETAVSQGPGHFGGVEARYHRPKGVAPYNADS